VITSSTLVRPAVASASSYLASLRTLLATIDLHAVDRLIGLLKLVRDDRRTIFIAGNGGSAATASHWVNDLGKATKRSGRLPIRAISLADNVSWLSALANDEGYARVFAGQLENFASANDVLIVISASGNSPNLLEAVGVARRAGMTSIGLLGFDGGELKRIVDDMVWVRCEKGAYELVEDAHAAICHAITRSLAADRAESV
jgi:D-sedoheptulose 7-phosphate isomerase